jgi:hypothetical protein
MIRCIDLQKPWTYTKRICLHRPGLNVHDTQQWYGCAVQHVHWCEYDWEILIDYWMLSPKGRWGDNMSMSLIELLVVFSS